MDLSSVDALPREELRQSSQLWRNTAGWELAKAGLNRQAAELMDCSDPLRAWQALVCAENHDHYQQVIVPSCKLPYCPMCAHARSAEIQREYTPIVQDALNASPDNYELRHVILTTPYSITHPDIDFLADSIWKKAVACMEIVWGVKQRNWKKNDLGILGGWEFGEDGHKLHIHMQCLCPWIDTTVLTDAWKEVTQGICQIVKVRFVRGVENGVREVAKYATKLTELPPQLVPVLHGILSGKRRIRAFGAFSCKIDQPHQEPMCCPECKGELIVLSLLNLRPGINFAGDLDTNPAKVPQESAIPPPIQHNFMAERNFSLFFDTFESKKR